MGTFDWDSFIDNLWERENAKGKRGVEGKGGYRNGKYYPYTTPNGNTDIGPGFDLKFQTPEFKERAKKGFTKAELDSIVKNRLQSEIGKFNQKITKLGGDSSSIPDNVYAGLLDMQWQLGSGLYDNYPNFWRAVANQDYEGMRRESVVTYKDSKGNRHVDTGRRNFRNNTYFTDPIVKETLGFPTEPVDALRVYNPYPTQIKSTVFVPPTVPDEDSYVKTRQLTQQEDASNRFNNAVEAYQNLNRIMDATSIHNTAAPRYVPKNAPYVAKRHSEGGFLQPKDAWDALSMQAKADVMRVAIKHGLYNLDDIRKKYNEFAEGGSKEEAEEVNTEKDYINTIERVAEENYRKWGYNNSDEALLHALNDNTYNYRGYYDKYPQSKANADTHWTDEFKTVYHPTFSNESIYSGKVSQYNPQGIVGGFWANDTFIPSVQQVMEESKIPLLDYLTNEYKNGGGIYIKPENRGKFTALKERTGHSATWFKEHGTPAQKKMAVFALNSRKWKHGEGGNLFLTGGPEEDGRSEITNLSTWDEFAANSPLFYTIGKALDPTGITGWGDAKEAIGQYDNDPSIGGGYNAVMETVGAIPVISKAGKVVKFIQGLVTGQGIFNDYYYAKEQKEKYGNELVVDYWDNTVKPRSEAEKHAEQIKAKMSYVDVNHVPSFRLAPKGSKSGDVLKDYSINSRIIKKYKHEDGGNLYNGGGIVGMPALPGISLREAIAKRLYDTTDALDGYDVGEFVTSVVTGNSSNNLKNTREHLKFKLSQDPSDNDITRRWKGELNQTDIADELYAQYLGIPVEDRHTKVRLSKSPYRSGSYRMPITNAEWDKIISETDDLNVGENTSTGVFRTAGLNTSAIGKGHDERGEYRSYGDSFDLNPFRGSAAIKDIPGLNKINDLSLGLFNPVEVYDRVYLDDYYGVPKEDRGGNYLPEIVITGKKKRKAFGGNLFDGEHWPTQRIQIGVKTPSLINFSTEQFLANAEKIEQQRKAMKEAIARRANNYLTTSNDATSTINGRQQNQHLEDRAIEGAKEHRAWEEDNPNYTAWGNVAGAIPFLVPTLAVGIPTLSTVGSSFATAIRSASPLVYNVGRTFLPWLDRIGTGYFGYQGIKDISHGNFTPSTALDLLPLTGKLMEQGSKILPYRRLERNYTGVPHSTSKDINGVELKNPEGSPIYMDDNFPFVHKNVPVWTTDDVDYAKMFTLPQKDGNPIGTIFSVYTDPKKLKILDTPTPPDNGVFFWRGLPFKAENGSIKLSDNIEKEFAGFPKNKKVAINNRRKYGKYDDEDTAPYIFRRGESQIEDWDSYSGATSTDDIVEFSQKHGYDATRFHRVDDGPSFIGTKKYHYPVNELVLNKGAEKYVLPFGAPKFWLWPQIEGKNHWITNGLFPVLIGQSKDE